MFPSFSLIPVSCFECISPYCKDFHGHWARTGVFQPQITSSDLFISFSPAACLLPFLVFFYSLSNYFFPRYFTHQSLSHLLLCCKGPYALSLFLFFLSFLFFFLFFPKTTLPIRAYMHYQLQILHTFAMCDGAPTLFVPQVGGRQFSPSGYCHTANSGNLSKSQCLTPVAVVNLGMG